MSSAVCEICGKRPHFSFQVSFSHKRSRRRWDPNIQRIRILDNGRVRRANVCTSCMKAGKVQRPPQRVIWGCVDSAVRWAAQSTQ